MVSQPQKKMKTEYQIGDRVKIRLDSKFGQMEGWYPGTVTRIEPYSEHRCFYWVLLDIESQTLLKVREISVFNPRNIQRLEAGEA